MNSNKGNKLKAKEPKFYQKLILLKIITVTDIPQTKKTKKRSEKKTKIAQHHILEIFLGKGVGNIS